MTEDQAKRLYNLQNEGAHVLFTGSPYVAQMESGEITKLDDGQYQYNDSAILEIDLADEDADDFTAYRVDDSWREAL